MFDSVIKLNVSRFERLSNIPDLSNYLGLSNENFRRQIIEMRNKFSQGQPYISVDKQDQRNEPSVDKMTKDELKY